MLITIMIANIYLVPDVSQPILVATLLVWYNYLYFRKELRKTLSSEVKLCT